MDINFDIVRGLWKAGTFNAGGFWRYHIQAPDGRYWQSKGFRTRAEARAGARRALKRQED